MARKAPRAKPETRAPLARAPPPLAVRVAGPPKEAGSIDARAAWIDAGKLRDDGLGEPAAVHAARAAFAEKALALAGGKLDFKEHVLAFPDGAPEKRLLLLSLGERDKLTLDRIRQLGARAAKLARDAGAKSLALAPPRARGVTPAEAARALAEGAALALYKFERYKSPPKPEEDEKRKRLAEIVVLAPGKERRAVGAAVERGVIVAQSVNATREWATLSGEEGQAPALAASARAMAAEVGLSCEVFDAARIRELGMGGVLAVNRGSPVEPRFVVLEHGKRHASRSGTLVLVGKGVTFDTGGLAIKPWEKMEEMKFDKAGAAAVWGALRAAALLDVGVHVVGLTPLVENVLGSASMKPGDVFRAFNGKTMEILNTDAEGRLILADALAFAKEHDPDAIVDIATLTGHIVVALGSLCSGMMGNDRRLLDAVARAADAAHERVAEMPFFDEYGEMVKGKYGDVKNHAGRPAGAITAAKFMEAFVPDGVPWVHLDVAGTAWEQGASPGFNSEYSPAQATGVGVRTFVALMEAWEEKPLKRRVSRGS